MRLMCCTIYKITNLINKKIYIGQTWQPILSRFKQHCQKNDSVKLYNAILKYGADNFTIERITSTATQDEADVLEKTFIDNYQSNKRNIGYNISNGGKGVGKHSEETKTKISYSLSGRKLGPMTDEHKINLSKSKIGHFVSEETKNKISESSSGRKLSDEHSKNIGLGHIGLTYNIKNPEERNKNISLGKKKKISDAQVLEIHEKWKSGQYTKLQLAQEYSTTEKYIFEIIIGRKRKLAII